MGLSQWTTLIIAGCTWHVIHVGWTWVALLQVLTVIWLTPCHLQPGKAMCDNSTNFCLPGKKKEHVPWTARVRSIGVLFSISRFFIITEGFVVTLGGGIWSAEIQRQYQLSANLLICDTHTCHDEKGKSDIILSWPDELGTIVGRRRGLLLHNCYSLRVESLWVRVNRRQRRNMRRCRFRVLVVRYGAGFKHYIYHNQIYQPNKEILG